MPYLFDQVADFHRAFSLPVADAPTLPDAATRALRIDLLREETSEYCEADAANDLVEVADALADIAYIACGTAVTYGLVPARYTMPFAGAEGITPAFPPEEFRQVLVQDMLTRFSLYVEAENADKLEAIREALIRVLGQVAATAEAFGICLRTVFDEVHRSNMSKLMADGSVLRRADGKVMKGENYTPPDIARVLMLAA